MPVAVAAERELELLAGNAPHFYCLVVGCREQRRRVGRKGHASHASRVCLDDARAALADVGCPQAHGAVLGAGGNYPPRRRDGH